MMQMRKVVAHVLLLLLMHWALNAAACAYSMKNSVHHVVYDCDMQCIVHVHIFTSTEAHLLTMPEWLQAFNTINKRVAHPRRAGWSVSCHP